MGLFSLLTGAVHAQNQVEDYVREALENNLVLQKKHIAFKQAQYALKEAKSLFYPTVELQADYTSAEGGRDIYLPLGDLLNPVYSTLNLLTLSNMFPQLENERINFLPHNYYDAKVRTSVPIFNAEMIYNKRIRSQQAALSQEELNIYKRDLVEQVKAAYYDYRKAADAIDIYKSSLKLAEEGKRVNQKLLDNGKGLPAYVLRAESEIEQVKSQLTEAKEDWNNAQKYFNFLLNRDLDSPIIEFEEPISEADILQKIGSKPDIANREELSSLQEVVELKSNLTKLDKSAYLPSLNGFLDLGSQAEDWEWNSQSQYYMFGFQLRMSLFAANQNKYKIKQAELAIDEAVINREQARKQLELGSYASQNKLQSAYQKYKSAEKQKEAAQTYHRLIERGYKEGVNTYIETIDARNQMSQAKVNLSISRYDLLKALAKLERDTATFELE